MTYAADQWYGPRVREVPRSGASRQIEFAGIGVFPRQILGLP